MNNNFGNIKRDIWLLHQSSYFFYHYSISFHIFFLLTFGKGLIVVPFKFASSAKVVVKM